MHKNSSRLRQVVALTVPGVLIATVGVHHAGIQSERLVEVQLPVENVWMSLPSRPIAFTEEFLSSSDEKRRIASWLDEPILRSLEALSPATLRFPGGTFANYYDWRTERLVAQIDHPRIPRYDWHSDVLANQSAFLSLCDSLGVEPLFVTNLYSRPALDAIEWFDSVRESHDGKVRYWELGNELNLYGRHASFRWAKSWNAEKYIRRADSVAAHMLAEDPTLTVLVNADEPAYMLNPRRAKKTSRWNDVLVDRPRSFNAVSMHIYLRDHRNVIKDLGFRVKFMFMQGDELPIELATWHSSYFGDLPLYLTEFGVSGRDNVEHRLWGYALAELNGVINLLAAPGSIRRVFKHLAFSRGTGRVAFQIDGKGGSRYTASGHAYLLLVDLLSQDPAIIRLEARGSGSFSGFGQYRRQEYPDVVVFGISDRDDCGIILINRSNEEVRAILPETDWKMSSITGDLDSEIIALKPSEQNLAHRRVATLAPHSFSVASKPRVDSQLCQGNSERMQ